MSLLSKALTIKGETGRKLNTATRVGGLFEDIANHLEGDFIWVNDITDLPTAVANVITLEAGKTYLVTTHIDLNGARLVAGGVCNVFGLSSETSSITSTGLGVSTPLITSEYTIVIENITIKDVGTAIDIDGNSRVVALDWENVNFENVPTVGTINTCDNFILETSSFLNAGGLTFTGTVGTIGISNSLFNCDAANTVFILNSGLTVTRRFRIIYSSFVVLSGETGINIDPTAVISTENYILDTVNFAGGGTYLVGVLDDSDKSLFVNCIGITNSVSIGNMYMKLNTTPTAIDTQGDRYNISGTTQVNGINRRFNHDAANNALQYVGAQSKLFHVNLTFTIAPESNNQKYGIYVGVNRGGSIDPTADRITESEAYINTSQAGRADAASIQALVKLNTNDKVYMIVQNTTSAADVTVEFLNMVIR